jgi:hypothetical protein
MGLGNLGDVIVILLIFGLLQIFIITSIGISNVRNDWDKYKCNPGIIPFAHIFGHDPGKTFNECIKSTQVDFMSAFLEPIYASMFTFAENGSRFTEIFEGLKLFGNNQDNAMGGFVTSAKNRIHSVGNELNKVYLDIDDTFSKLTSTLTILLYVVQTSIETGRLAWNEIPGTFMKMAGL